MPTDGIGGLPARPLTEAERQSLNRHAATEFCHPIYHLAEDADAIVAIYLGSNDRIHVLLYNPTATSWERIDTIDTPASLTEASELNSEAVQTRFDTYYDETDVEPAGYPQDPMASVAGNLPPAPLSDEQLAAIRDRPFIAVTIPFVRRASDDRLITLFLVFEDPIESQRIVGAYGYDPTEAAWRVLGTTEGSAADPERAFDALAEDTVDWLDDSYSRDDIRLVDDPEHALSS